MWLIDTNVFLRVLVREDETCFLESKALLERVKQGEIKALSCGIVLAELVWVLGSVYGLGKKEVVEKVNGVLLLPGLKIVDGYDYRWALEQYQNKRVKYIDACIASIPGVRRGEVTVVTYDKDFGKLDCRWIHPGGV